MTEYVCIEIGGTALKYGLADAAGVFSDKRTVPSELQEKGATALVEKVIGIVRDYQAEHAIQGVAISTAGIVDPEQGSIIYAMPHFPGYTGTPLARLISEAAGVFCTVENDVNCAGLGELWQGAGQGVDSLCCMTVGTGIGGCVLLQGKLVHGAAYSAGEVGYLRIGQQGSLEDLASTRQLVRQVAAAKGLDETAVDGRQIFAWAKAGDAIAVRGIDTMLHYLSLGMANICYVLNPARIVLGGGIMEQQEYLAPRIQRAFAEVVIPAIAAHTDIAFARLGNDAGMTGALYNHLQRSVREK